MTAKRATPAGQATWNSPEAIARHRAMSPSERVKLAIEVSRAAQKFAAAGRGHGR